MKRSKKTLRVPSLEVVWELAEPMNNRSKRPSTLLCKRINGRFEILPMQSTKFQGYGTITGEYCPKD
jgi:hypothetical protein